MPADERDRALDLVDYWTPLTLRLCAEAGVLDAFGREERDVVDVAAKVGIDAGVLARMLRALTARGVFETRRGGRLRLTALGEQFLADEPGSLGGMLNFLPWYLHAWAEAGHTLRTGEPGFVEHYGTTMFDWLAAHPAEAARFNDVMRRRTGTLLAGAIPLWSWPASGTVADIGGGRGHLLAGVLAARPALRGVVFDLPHVVVEARPVLERAGVADRADLAGGSFFDHVPPAHEVYVLAGILHDWDDDLAGEILGRCRDAMAPGSRLVLFEHVLRPGDERDLGKQLDLHMLVMLGGRERDAHEWERLLRSAGLALVGITPTPGGTSWIEAMIEPRR